MQFEKYLHRIQYIKELILRESTGNARQLAARLGISERMVYRYIREISEHDGEIEFNRLKNSYKFKD